GHAGSPTPRPTATPAPTPRPTATPAPTARPTARPTPTPTPAEGKVKKPRPPCPTADGGPPGHNKVQGPQTRPCGATSAHRSNGIVIMPPLALLGIGVWGLRRFAVGVRRVRRPTRTAS